MEKLIMTMPIKPQKRTNIGMYIAPVILNTLSDISGYPSVMAINLLNTYTDKTKELNIYLTDLNNAGIKFDNLFIDKVHAEKIMNFIRKMYLEHKITVNNEVIYRCKCGKVDILKDGINDNLNKLYYKKEDKYYCKDCNTQCLPYFEQVLVLNLDHKIDDRLSITPCFLNNDANHLSKIFKGGRIIVSKARDTGYYLEIDHKKFNIDVDFLWMNYFRCFKEKEIIMIASNHQMYQMYLLNYLNKILGEKTIHFIATPYMNNSLLTDPLIEFERNMDEFYKKLFILYNLKWKNKNCDWSTSVIKYLNTINADKRRNLYNIIVANKNFFNTGNINQQMEEIFFKKINMQSNIKNCQKKLEYGGGKNV